MSKSRQINQHLRKLSLRRVRTLYLLTFGAILISSCEMTYENDICLDSVSACDDLYFIALDTDADWSPDGSTIAFFSSDSAETNFGIHLINSDGSDKRMFHSGLADAPTWSPDGKWIAFHLSGDIYKKHVDSDTVIKLTIHGHNFYPDWSPSGSLITYDRSLSNESGPSGIWIMNTDGSDRHHVFGGAFPTWHPHVNSILAVIGTSSTSFWKRFLLHYPDGSRQDSIFAPSGEYSGKKFS